MILHLAHFLPRFARYTIQGQHKDICLKESFIDLLYANQQKPAWTQVLKVSLLMMVYETP